MVAVLTKRIIPCLDIKNGNVVKGTKFGNLKYAGNPLELAKRYYSRGADELIFLDIDASYENRKTTLKIVEEIGKNIFIPFTVGGGIQTIEDIRKILNAGADKISVNTSAIKNPEIIKKASKQFGSQCIVVAIDAKRKGNNWEVYIEGGRKTTGLDAIKWAKKAEMLGAGEILLTSMDKDGTKEGYDLSLTKKVSESVNIPVIASGGANNLRSILEVFRKGKADAALAASIFHYNKFSIKDVKKYLSKNGVEIRK